MPCNCKKGLSGASAENIIRAKSIIACLRTLIQAPPGTKWDAEAHTALYRKLGQRNEVRLDRGLMEEQIAAIPFGSEPVKTAEYVMSYAKLWGDPALWLCIKMGTGVTEAEAGVQQTAQVGPWWDMLKAVGELVLSSEKGVAAPDAGTADDSGWPWWGWALGGAAGLGALYLILRK